MLEILSFLIFCFQNRFAAVVQLYVYSGFKSLQVKNKHLQFFNVSINIVILVWCVTDVCVKLVAD